MFSISKYRRPINLRFYTNNSGAHKLFKPDKATKYLPDWAKAKDEANRRVRACYGFSQTFTRGFVVPIWADTEFNVSVEGAKCNLDVKSFDESLKTEMLRSPFMQVHNTFLLKLSSPWLVECDEDVGFTVAENMWSNPSRAFNFMSGAAAFKYQHGTNMFFYLPMVHGKHVLRAGDTPLVWVPQSDRTLKIDGATYDPEKFAYLAGTGTTFLNHRYARAKQLLGRR
jgi:hypothetical protein